jgi:subtilisin family serine protease
MSRAQLTAAANLFFSRILPAATQKHFSDLTNAEVLLGSYRRNTAGPVLVFGQSITPEFILQVAPGAVAVQNDAPALGDGAVAADAARQPLIWMRYAADPKVDDQATIQDLMGDLDTYVARKFNLAGVDIEVPDSTAAPANSQQWAQTITANRSAIPDNLSTLTDVPAPFKPVAPTLSAFQVIMSHFFTYDENGAYYARWSGSGRQMPQGLTDVYRQKNVRELKLGRDQLYVYLLAPKSLFTTQNAEAHDYCEAVIRFEETGDPTNPYLPTLIQSVYKRVPDGTPVFHDFIFFEAEDGVGLNVPLAARVKMSPGLTNFLLTIPDRPEDRQDFYRHSSQVIDGTPPHVALQALMTGGAVTLPDGVTGVRSDDGDLMNFVAPIDKAADIANLPGVSHLDITSYEYQPSLQLVRNAIQLDAFRNKFAAGKQDGAGVLVGIIDSGIDGNHPAFKDAAGNSRILAYWDISDGAVGNPNSPAAHNPGNARYSNFRMGRERLGADCVNASDYGIGHGSHVSGIATGSEVTGPAPVPRGIASAANLIVVSTIGRPINDPVLALNYIFQKASDLHMPCVVNMSFGHHFHAHDGTDSVGASVAKLVKARGSYLPGRILVAAAGNERTKAIHARRNLVQNGSGILNLGVNFVTNPASPSNRDDLTVWIRALNPGTRPNLRIAIQDPTSGWTSAAVTPSSAPQAVNIPGVNLRVVFSAMTQHPFNGDFDITISFVPQTGAAGLARQQWRLLITNPGPPVEINVWDGRDGAFLNPVTADMDMKVGTPACAFDVISVAASCSRLTWPDIDTPANTRNFGQPQLNDLASFSSQGPIRTCSNRVLSFFGMQIDTTFPAIDIAAPGSATQSALASVVPTTPASNNRQFMVNNLSWMMQGTSMASPVITGLIACMLAEEPALTQQDARNRLRAAGRLPDGSATIFKPGAPDADDWGPGLVNAPALKP